MTNHSQFLKKEKSLTLISEVPGSEFKLAEPCKMTSKTMAKVCPCILFASDTSYEHLFASEASWLSPQVVVFWIAFSPYSSWASDKEPRRLPQDSRLLCKGEYLKV